MKKLLIVLIAILGMSDLANAHMSNNIKTNNGSIYITSMDNEEYVDSVTATIRDGSLKKNFTVYCRRLPSGKYLYFVRFGGEEYTVFWVKEYRCFAIQANALWLFHSRSLENSFYSYNKKAYNA